ncbi:hypothetical protein ACO0OL_001553 [Hanseniaspora opuntiae]
MHAKFIFTQAYKSRDLFKNEFSEALESLVSSFDSTLSINVYIPQKSALSILNSYITFDELKQKFGNIKIYNQINDLENENNVIVLQVQDVLNDLSYADIETLQKHWGSRLNKVLILGQESSSEFQELKEKTIKFIYKIPEDISLEIEMIDVPLFRLGEEVFSATLSEEDNLVRPIKTDKSKLLNMTRKWMEINGVENINKIISCEGSSGIDSYDLAAHDLSSMLEQEYKTKRQDDLLFDSKRDCNVMIFDRSCDRITPLLTDLTYAGLLKVIDKEFLLNIITKENNNGCELKDNIFENLKFLNFGEVGSVLQRLLKSYGKATDTKLTTDTSVSDELNRMIKMLSNEEVISNSKNLPRHVNEASKMMDETKNPKYNLEDIIDIESLLLSEWNTQSRYLNNNTKIKFSWNKLANSGNKNSKIVDDFMIIEWIEEQNFLGNYTFEKLMNLLILYIKLYGPFARQEEFYNRLLTSFSDRFGSDEVCVVFEKMFDESVLVIDTKFNNSLFSLGSKQEPTKDLEMLENNKRHLNLMNYLHYVSNTERENPMYMSLLDTLNKTTSAVGFDFLQNLGLERVEDTALDPLSFAYCGIVPVITRLLQYVLTVDSFNPSVLKLGIPLDIINDAGNQEIKSLLSVSEKQLMKHKSGSYKKSSKLTFAKTLVIFTNGATMGELATIDKLNKLMIKSCDISEDTEMVPISVITDKII